MVRSTQHKCVLPIPKLTFPIPKLMFPIPKLMFLIPPYCGYELTAQAQVNRINTAYSRSLPRLRNFPVVLTCACVRACVFCCVYMRACVRVCCVVCACVCVVCSETKYLIKYKILHTCELLCATIAYAMHASNIKQTEHARFEKSANSLSV